MRMAMYSGDGIRVVHPLFQVEGGGSIPTSPLQLHVGQITLEKAMQLNEIWHSRLPITDRSNLQRVKNLACYGAEFDGLFYAASIWTDPIARKLNGKQMLELRRFAIAPDAPRNTGSRLLSVMRLLIEKKFPHIQKFISYQDIEVHRGTIYRAAGWTELPPSKIPIDGWNTRIRAKTQTNANKIRWELDLATS